MFQFKTLILLLFLKQSFQYNCSVTYKDEAVHVKCGNLTGSINMIIKERSAVNVKCKGYVNEVSELMPKLNDSIVVGPIYIEVDKSCPFPRNFSDLTVKTKGLSGFKYAFGELGNLTSQILNGLTELESLILVSDGIKFIATKAFQSLPKLSMIDLSNNSIAAITADTSQSNFFLNEIQINFNLVDLTLEGNCFANKTELKIVTVTRSENELFLCSYLFTNSTNLNVLDFSNSGINTLDGNVIAGTSVRSLILPNNFIIKLSLDENFEDVSFLDISGNFIQSITFDTLLSKPYNIKIHLSNFLPTSLSKNFLINIKSLKSNDKFALTLTLDFYCDLSLHSLMRTKELQNQINITYDKSHCNSPLRLEGKSFAIISRYVLACVSSGYFSNCICVFDDQTQTLHGKCNDSNFVKPPEFEFDPLIPEALFDEIIKSVELNFTNNKLSRLPELIQNVEWKITKLSARNNSIGALQVENFMDSIEYLDLRDNNLKVLPDDVITRIQQVKVVLLGARSWKCDCSALPFINLLKSMENQNIIKDFPNMVCAESGKPLADMNYFTLCFNWPLAAIATSFLGLIAILTALFYKYKKVIKIYLYAKNCCLWFVNEEELDEDKNYDAFICFAAEDQLIVEDIIIGLEDPPGNYNCLVGCRDWPPGVFIPELISNSVEQSRRTVIFLSANFIDSHWCNQEFRAAQVEASHEQRNRIIIITHGDIEETDKMSNELKTYLRLHLYIKFEDPKFWDKLLYAMPHRKRESNLYREARGRRGGYLVLPGH